MQRQTTVNAIFAILMVKMVLRNGNTLIEIATVPDGALFGLTMV